MAANIVPVPSGWSIVCNGPSASVDGQAFNGVINLYPDAEDADHYLRYVLAHEIGHAWQWAAEVYVEEYAAATGIDSTPSTYLWERHADDFACAYGYCYDTGDPTGATAACASFARPVC